MAAPLGFGKGIHRFAVVDEDFGVVLGPIRTHEQLKSAMISECWPDNDVRIYAISEDGRSEIRTVPRMNKMAGKPTVGRNGMRAEDI